MKYIIRSGKVKGEGRYLVNGGSTGRYPDGAWQEHPTHRWRFDTREEADKALHCFMPDTRRIVRLLSHEESKAKAKATMLRELSYEYALISDDDLLKKADELWPAKGEK